jgi:putative ABC transport system permease protein
MMAFHLGLRQLLSHWAAGDIRVLFAALVLAVTATTSVNFFTERIQASIVSQGGALLGADLVVTADHPLPAHYAVEGGRRSLTTVPVVEFPSMIIHGEQSQLAEIKAVGSGFPLRGDLAISTEIVGGEHIAGEIPAPGEVWISPRLAGLLELQVGQMVEVGERPMRVSAILQREPSRGGEMFSIAPRLMMNVEDVPSTGLIQYGSRARYQLLAAGDAATVAAYSTWAQSQLARGERVEDVSSARPEIRSARDRAEQFLGLAAMVAAVLSMVAMFLASLPYVQRSFDTYALMRCFGANTRLISHILAWQMGLLALFGSLLGCVFGYLAQSGLASMAGRLFVEQLPAPGWYPVLAGLSTGFLTMLAVFWPHFYRLRRLSALRILRRDLGEDVSWHRAATFLPAMIVMSGLILWYSGSVSLGIAVIAGFAGLLLTVGLLAWIGSRTTAALPLTHSSTWRLGVAGIKRRPGLAIAQITGFSVGLSALILLALIRTDLLANWQSTLPEDAPNRFVINIQPEQVAPVQAALSGMQIHDVGLFPMVRARLTAINDEPLDVRSYEDERARHLAEREFNLSWADQLQPDNEITAGNWWGAEGHGKHFISLEQGLAETLRLKLGDRLMYDVAGEPLELTVTSLRKVNWDSMRTNFFAVTPPEVLNHYPASYITSFHLPLGSENLLNQLVKRFPNLTVIDIAALLQQVRDIMVKMTHAIEYVFGFSLLAGLAVLYSALAATRDERVYEATLLRVLGASRRQVVLAMLVEFTLIATLSAVIATVTANAIAVYLCKQVLSIEYTFNWQVSLLVLLAAMFLIPFAAWIGTRKLLNIPPRNILYST